MNKEYTPRLQAFYYDKIIPKMLKEDFPGVNVHQLPKLEKIVLNMRIGDITREKKRIEKVCLELAAIAGQKPIIIKAKKSISGFGIREGMPVALKVTLRGQNMYHFLDRVINIALPRVHDFRGFLPKSFNGKGSFSFGIHEHSVFPEINYDTMDKARGFNITFTVKSGDDSAGVLLLSYFNMPFKGYLKKGCELWPRKVK